MPKSAYPSAIPVIHLDYPLLSWHRMGAVGLRLLALLIAGGAGFWLGLSRNDLPAEPFVKLPDAIRYPKAIQMSNPSREQAQDSEQALGRLLRAYPLARGDLPLAPGPRILDLKVRRAERGAALDFTLTAESNGTPYEGTLRFEIAGLRNGRVEVLQAPGPEVSVSGPAASNLAFSRYVRSEGALRLPQAFTPLLVGAAMPPGDAARLRLLACSI